MWRAVVNKVTPPGGFGSGLGELREFTGVMKRIGRGCGKFLLILADRQSV